MARSFRPLLARDRLLVVRLGAVGDVLRALPAVHAIRRTFPGIHLGWIVEDLSFPLLEGHPDLDRILRFPRRELSALGRPRLARGPLARLREEIRSQCFTVAIDLQSSFKSGILAWLSGAARRVGFSPGHCRELSFLFTNEWVRPSSRRLNRVERNLELAGAVGASTDEARLPIPERPEEARRATELLRSLLPEGAPAVLVSPGASRRQAYKMWPGEHYARLAASLSRADGVRPIVVWGPGEEGLARSVVAASGGGALLAPPTGLRLLAALSRRSSLFVGADTGPMHLAWAVGCPVVALFGPTDPRLNAPLGEGDVVLRAPGGRMAELDPEVVLDAVRRRLAARQGSLLEPAPGPVRIARRSRGPA